MMMKKIIKERLAHVNGVSINNKMLKEAERNDIYYNNYLSSLFAEEYNKYIEAFPEKVEKDFPEIYERIRKEALARIKYHFYYEWEYY